MKKYLITEMFQEDSMSVDWTKIPEDFLSMISKNLYNVSSITKNGDIVERTVVFIKPVKKFKGNVNTVVLNNEIEIGREIDTSDIENNEI